MAEKLRVYQLAKELGVSSREVIWALGQLNVEVKNHMSTVEPDLIVGVKTKLRIPVEPGEAPVGEQEQDDPPEPAPARQSPPQSSPEPGPESEPKSPEPKSPEPKPQETTASKPPDTGPKRRSGRKGRARQDSQKRDGRRRRRGRERTTLSDLQAERGRREPILIEGPMTVGNLAQRLGVRATEAIRRLMGMGVMAGINQEVEPDVAAALALELGVEVVERISTPEDAVLLKDEEVEAGEQESRWPVVTVMGHVDHGKTSLLDAIRETDVTSGEAGGITQRIGASTVEFDGKRVVFLDTPGHEAFTAMRARGAQATDLAVVVVAADDGVMPQTIEAINHARAAQVPILVAVNKIDRPDANPERVKQQLSEHGLVPEDWGGDTVFVPVSARTKEGIPGLLEMVALLAEMQELSSRASGRAVGIIIESELDKGQGPVATVLVQAGELVVGDAFVSGGVHGKVRAMIDERGRRLRRVGSSLPVKVLGFQEVPAAGDQFQVVADERRAREIAEYRRLRQKQHQLEASDRVRLDQLFASFKEGKVHQLNLIIKADAQGSLEALSQALEKLETTELKVAVIHTGVGAVTESDVMLAAASGAIIIGFNVRPETSASAKAAVERVDIRTYRVIYDVIDNIKKALEGMLEPESHEVMTGRAEVRATFKVPRIGIVAGCYVTEGKIVRSAMIRVVRDGVVVSENEIDSLRRFKDDVREVVQNYECGIGLKGFQDIKEGDVLEAFVIEEVRP